MFKKPVWDDLSFVTWCIILLEQSSEDGTQSSAAVAHLLQGSKCCAFRDCFQHTLLVTRGYLSYCCLSIFSIQSVHSPLISDINKAFSTKLPLTGYFLFFGPFSVNPRDGCVWKSQKISSFWNTQTGPSAPTIIPRSESLKSPFFPILMLGLNFSKSSSPHLDAKIHWVAALWLAD